MSEHTGPVRVSWALLENLLGFDNVCEQPGSHGLGCIHSRIEITGAEQPLGYIAVDFKVKGDVLRAKWQGKTVDGESRYEVTTHATRNWVEVRKV